MDSYGNLQYVWGHLVHLFIDHWGLRILNDRHPVRHSKTGLFGNTSLSWYCLLESLLIKLSLLLFYIQKIDLNLIVNQASSWFLEYKIISLLQINVKSVLHENDQHQWLSSQSIKWGQNWPPRSSIRRESDHRPQFHYLYNIPKFYPRPQVINGADRLLGIILQKRPQKRLTLSVINICEYLIGFESLSPNWNGANDCNHQKHHNHGEDLYRGQNSWVMITHFEI